MVLKLGIMTNAELANWFGVTQGSFKATKAKKLEELKDFADFEEVKGKVNIKEIYYDTYVKRGSKAYEIYKEEFDKEWSDTGIDSCSRVNTAILTKREADLKIKESTGYYYTRKTRNELYGVPFMAPGIKGTCEYKWVKCVGEGLDIKYIPLTPEEEKIKKDLHTKYFGDSSDKSVMIKAMVMRGELTKEEAWDAYENISNMTDNAFMNFLTELRTALGGCKLVHGTEIHKFIETKEGEGAF